MDDWRTPKAKLKGWTKELAYSAFAMTGRLCREKRSEQETLSCDPAFFYGDRMGLPERMGLHQEHRLEFKEKRPDFERVANIDYSENGMAWCNGSLIEKYSVLPIGMADLRTRPPTKSRFAETCAIVQSDYVYSYGDWVHCYLGTILSADFPDVPILVPKRLADKGYVQRDLNEAKVNWIAAEGWTQISDAIVLRKKNPYFYWSKKNVADFRTAFVPASIKPDDGSILYLGRFDLHGETISRKFPSDEVADYVRSVDGSVVSQSELTTTTSRQYANGAETVIGDHGSGLLNIMFWRPKTVIELVVDDWWVNNTLFVAAGMGVENFGVIKVDGMSSQQIGEKISECQMFFDQKR